MKWMTWLRPADKALPVDRPLRQAASIYLDRLLTFAGVVVISGYVLALAWSIWSVVRGFGAVGSLIELLILPIPGVAIWALFELFRQHPIREIPERIASTTFATSLMIDRLPIQFYKSLSDELDILVTQFDQLRKDYDRELRGDRVIFAVDFAEIHSYMYSYSSQSARSSLNQYIFNTLDDPFTLMPGAVGELLTDLERALPTGDTLEQNPLTAYSEVAKFVSEFPAVLANEAKVIELYGRAEAQLEAAWGQLFDVVMGGVRHTAFGVVKSLIDQGRLSPIDGIQTVSHLPVDAIERAQLVRIYLDVSRPDKAQNNQVDAIDFAATWLLNEQGRDVRKRYISIYTQSRTLIAACTAKQELRWEDDYLVRGSEYLKFRTRLQEMLPSIQQRQEFVVKWAVECRRLQKEITSLVDSEKELPELRKPNLRLLELYQELDEECRIPLSYTGEWGVEEEVAVRERAEKLFALLTETGEFRGKIGEAYEVLKAYLRELQEYLALFAPNKVRTSDPKTYMEYLARWLES